MFFVTNNLLHLLPDDDDDDDVFDDDSDDDDNDDGDWSWKPPALGIRAICCARLLSLRLMPASESVVLVMFSSGTSLENSPYRLLVA